MAFGNRDEPEKRIGGIDWIGGREGCKQEVVNFTKFIFNGHLKTGRQAEILTGGNAQNKKASIVNFVDIEATFGTVPFPYSYIHRFKGYLLSTSFVLQIFTKVSIYDNTLIRFV